MDEFALIRDYFTAQSVSRSDVVVGIGDDAAVLKVPSGMELVVTTDTLVAGTHFPEDTDPYSIAHKALAVNLSDLAAMGAQPVWATLALTLPTAGEEWLAEFSRGLFDLARDHQVQLVGGDTVRGPLSVCMQAYGWVPAEQALLRRGAAPGDEIYVTGVLGDAGLGLRHVQGTIRLPEEEAGRVVAKLNRPTPRVREGMALRGLASAAIDLSDGLVADLGHVLRAGGVGARVQLRALPFSKVYARHFGKLGWDTVLANGDDYELCFTVPVEHRAVLERLVTDFTCGFTRIGEIESEPGLRLVAEDGRRYTPQDPGYNHFR